MASWPGRNRNTRAGRRNKKPASCSRWPGEYGKWAMRAVGLLSRRLKVLGPFLFAILIALVPMVAGAQDPRSLPTHPRRRCGTQPVPPWCGRTPRLTGVVEVSRTILLLALITVVVLSANGVAMAYGGGDPKTIECEGGECRGTPNSETMRGTHGRDIMYGRAGWDDIYGLGGKDRLYGDASEDDLYGNAGDDKLSGGAQQDSLYGGDGPDSLNGGKSGDYELNGAAGDDRLFGGPVSTRTYSSVAGKMTSCTAKRATTYCTAKKATTCLTGARGSTNSTPSDPRPVGATTPYPTRTLILIGSSRPPSASWIGLLASANPRATRSSTWFLVPDTK
jgi:hypothetical protein